MGNYIQSWESGRRRVSGANVIVYAVFSDTFVETGVSDMDWIKFFVAVNVMPVVRDAIWFVVPAFNKS